MKQVSVFWQVWCFSATGQCLLCAPCFFVACLVFLTWVEGLAATQNTGLSAGLSIISPQWVVRSLQLGCQQRCLHMSLDASRQLPPKEASTSAAGWLVILAGRLDWDPWKGLWWPACNSCMK